MFTQKIGFPLFFFNIPTDWEITSYSKNLNVGRFEFHNIDGFKAIIAWEKQKKIIDIEITLTEYHREYLVNTDAEEAYNFTHIDFKKANGFIIGYRKDREICQCGYYDKKNKLFLNLIFPNYTNSYFEKTILPIIKSYKKNDSDLIDWSLFSTSLKLPRNYEIEEINPYPANLNLFFEDSKKLSHINYFRWGMPDILLEETSLKNFYFRQLKKTKRVESINEIKVFNFDAVKIIYRQRPEYKLNSLIGKLWYGEATAWYDTDELRIHAFEHASRKKENILEVEDVFQKRK